MALIQAAGLSLRETLRQKGTPYLELAWTIRLCPTTSCSGDVAPPILITRPFVETPLGVRYAPSEQVLDILRR